MGLVPPRWGWRGAFVMGVLMGAPVAADVAVDSGGFVVVAPRVADLVPSVVLPGAESTDIINERAGGVAEATPAVTEVLPSPPRGTLSIMQAQQEALRAKHLAVVLVLMRCPSRWAQIRSSVQKVQPVEPAIAVGDLVAQLMSGDSTAPGNGLAPGGRVLLGVAERTKRSLIGSNAIGPITLNDLADAQHAGQTTDLRGFNLTFFRERARLDALQRARIICEVEPEAKTLDTREAVWAELCLAADDNCGHHARDYDRLGRQHVSKRGASARVSGGGLTIEAEESPTTWIVLIFIVATGGGMGIVCYRLAFKSLGGKSDLLPGLDLAPRLSRLDRHIAESSLRLSKLGARFLHFQSVISPRTDAAPPDSTSTAHTNINLDND